MTQSDIGGSKIFARIARELASQPDGHDTMVHLVQIAKTLIGCDQVAVWALPFGGTRPLLRASSDHDFRHQLQRMIYDLDEGPIYRTLTDHAPQLVHDITTEHRWPRYTERIGESRLPIRSVLTFPLDLCAKYFGALALYSAQPGYFTDRLVDLAGVVADHATLALNTAQAEDQAEHMRVALESNRRIGIAIGVLMTLHKITEDQAFAMLRTASQHSHVKLRELAEDIILTGEIPEWPTRRPAPPSSLRGL